MQIFHRLKGTSPSLAVANRWGGTSSLFTLVIIPDSFAVATGTGGPLAATAIVDVGIATDTAYIIAGTDDALLL